MIPGRCRGSRWAVAGNVVAILLVIAGTQALARDIAPWSPAVWSAPWSGDVILVAAGLLLLGLAFLAPLHAGLLNVGIYAQFLAGFSVAAAIARGEALDPAARAGLALVVGAGAGLLLGALMGWLKRRFAVHEILSGVLLGAGLGPVARALAVSPTSPPALRVELSILEGALRLAPGLELPRTFVLAWGILVLALALILAAVLGQMLRTSVRGFELRTVGSNPLAAVAAGVDVERVQLAMMMLGGACAGMTGALQLWREPAVALERWPLPLAIAGLSIVFYGLGSMRGVVIAAALFAGWLNAPGTLAVVSSPGWGAAVAALLVLPVLWVLPRLLPDQGAPRSTWRTRHRDPF